jgi:dTDP-4-amino-4,6-dideoxygalactose transaminase
MKVPFVNFGGQYMAHKDEYDDVWFRLNEAGQYILQEEGEKFEENLAKFLGMKYAVAVANGTDALLLALIAKSTQVPNVVNVTDYTFKATHEAIHHSGSIPNRVDINPETRMPDVQVDVPVHIEGMVHRSSNAVVEDACQAFGAKDVGYSGTACLSFYPAKIFGCPGDGGAVVTNEKDVYDLVRLLRHHWQSGHDEEYGYNSRLDNIKAGFLNVKLKYIPEILKRREEIATKYNKALDGYVGLPYAQPGRVWQDYVITTKNQKELTAFLKRREIGILGNDMVPNFKAMNSTSKLPNTEKLYKEMLRLPCNETVSDEQVDYVIDTVKEFFSHDI